MPRKSATTESFREELERIAIAAFDEARKKADIARKAKAEATKALIKHRNLRTIVAAVTGPQMDGDGSVGFRRSSKNVHHDDWPWRVALALRGMTPSDYARLQRSPPLGVETAKSWLKADAKRKRPCPEFWANKIAADFTDKTGRSEVPAVDGSWPHGIKRG